uniref:Multidrug resistance protein n=1 Tax=Lygus hesperus TaxID=30085 RepID=A0A0A9YRC5_LYGHE
MTFCHVSMRYRDGLPLVLHDVNFTIHPHEKVAIVGRTGSGKSTLLLTFLRLVNICGGEIVISGKRHDSYSLPALRKMFALVPQDPVLFDGTVGSNLDPFQ